MPFLTDLDSRAAVKGSRDPLGIQPIWTRLGRHVIGNLTTQSTSVRDFGTLLLGYHFAEVLTSLGAPADENIKTFFTDTKDALIAPASPLRAYVGYVGSDHVAALEAFNAHGVISFYDMAQLPSTKGKPYAAALLLNALKEAKKAGLRVACLQTPEGSRAVYERIGFKPVGRIATYA